MMMMTYDLPSIELPSPLIPRSLLLTSHATVRATTGKDHIVLKSCTISTVADPSPEPPKDAKRYGKVGKLDVGECV